MRISLQFARSVLTSPAARLPSLTSTASITDAATAARPRLPSWLRVNLPAGQPLAILNATHGAIAEHGLHTVCEEARCPNLNDCWSRGTATFMVAGKECTRGCRFCSVETRRNPEPPDPNEPEELAAAVERMGLAHVVITVVNRDDLADGGADHYKRCVEAVHDRLPHVTIELLSSDLAGDEAALQLLAGWHSACRLRAQRRMRAAARPAGARSAGVVRTKLASAATGARSCGRTCGPRAASWLGSAKRMRSDRRDAAVARGGRRHADARPILGAGPTGRTILARRSIRAAGAI